MKPLNPRTAPCYSPAIKPFRDCAMDQKTFDRAAEDLGNAIHLEHVNVTIPDQRIASLFYGAGLASPATRTDGDGRQHVDERRPQPIPSAERQAAGAARQDRDCHRRPRGPAQAARHREAEARRHQVRLHRDTTITSRRPAPGATHPPAEPDAARFGRINLGIPYVEFDVPVGAAKGIAKFYREMIDCRPKS